MTGDLLSALPSRPLQARPPLMLRSHLRSALGLCVLAAILAACAAWLTPELLTDWLVRDGAAHVIGGELTDGTCHEKLFLQDCEATLTAPVRTPAGDRGTITRRVHYLFASTGTEFTSGVLADPQHPLWLTTELGQAYFWDRVLIYVLGVACLLTLLCLGALGIRRQLRIRLSWRAAALRPVRLQLVSVRRAGLSATWTVRSGTGRTVAWGFPRWARPCRLGAGDQVLGLATAGEGAVLPVDAGLRWVKLSRGERQAALSQPR